MTDLACRERPTCEQVIEILPEPFVIIDRNYRIQAANRHYRAKYGIPDEEPVLGRYCYQVSHRASQPCSQLGELCPLEAVFETGAPLQVMHMHQAAAGREEYVQISATPLVGERGEVLYLGEQLVHVSQQTRSAKLLVGRSRPLLHMMSLLHRVAPTQTTVLLLGESGVGKECVAQYLHHFSSRSGGPFVLVDCGTLGESLIESELFGHEKGAFTGASSRKLGLFEAAHGGTLFIDEIGDMPLGLQTKLLRVLESGTIRRLGGTGYLQVDVRVVAATHRDLQAMVAQGRFREDLYYRLCAFPIRVPPLRDRKDDIPALAEHFLGSNEDGERLLPLAPKVLETLLDYDYPGNVRELRNIIERAAILACDDPIQPDHLVFEWHGARQRRRGTALRGMDLERGKESRRAPLRDEDVLAALRQHDGHRARTACALGVNERTLYRYLKRLRSQ